MPDWETLVRERLRVLRICPSPAAEELVPELASHLEDHYEDSLRKGLPSETAFRNSLDQIDRLPRLWLELRILQEEIMIGFTRKVLLPGFLAFVCSMAIAWTLAFAGVQPRTVSLPDGLYLPLPIAWFCLLPFCGAIAAILSHRRGGSYLQRATASIFPAAILGSALLVMFITALIQSQFVA